MICGRCKKNPTTSNQGYCRPCAAAYQREYWAAMSDEDLAKRRGSHAEGQRNVRKREKDFDLAFRALVEVERQLKTPRITAPIRYVLDNYRKRKRV